MNRWAQLAAAVVAMIMIGNLQYSWTLFVKPIIAATGWKLSDVQWGFTFFIAFETWVMPLSGWLIDRLGPRVFLSLAAVLCGAGWAGLGEAKSLTALYLLYSTAGVGAALVYSGSIAVALKWFPDRRGLAAGIIAAGFGSGAAPFIPIIAYIIRIADYRAAFLYTGIAQGLLILMAAQVLRNPDASFRPPTGGTGPVKVRRHSEEFNSFQMLRTPHFYLFYLMMLMMGVGGLMVTAQVAPVADSLGLGMAALTLALSLNPLANGAGRIFWGWVSDHVGRERTMVVAFFLQSLCLMSVMTLGRQSAAAFIVSLALVYFTWGEVYVLFPSACADYFGARHASSNYSFLYSTKGVASIVGGGLAARLFEQTGDWTAVFYGSAALALCSAVMAAGLRLMPLPGKKQATVSST
ncbi:MAG: oxalate/formate MFS antiporter [Acidobacteria bacterium]|nr:oxalate/formate MFS antiporter [Acidobacteriota bacterium]